MKYEMIATWKMALVGVEKGMELLRKNYSIEEAVIQAVCEVENNPNFRSVGYGGLPNENGIVELDAAFMNGDSLQIGAVMSVRNIKNPIKVARELSKLTRNNILSSRGAEEYAQIHSFETQDMLTFESKQKWINQLQKNADNTQLESYGGHDTVCIIGKDKEGKFVNAVSTSGLFMKKNGRVGDSPIVGSGFYCDSEIGGASATGVGEDIMKGCLSIRIVEEMKLGKTPQEACNNILDMHLLALKRKKQNIGTMSVIALDKEGNFGAATNKKEFPFVVGKEDEKVKIFVASYIEGKHSIFEPDQEWLHKYRGD